MSFLRSSAAGMIVLSGIFLVSCKTSESDSGQSTPSQLVEQIGSYKCDVRQDRFPMIEKEYMPSVVGGDAAWRQKVVGVLSVWPDEYLNWVFKVNKVRLSMWSSSGGLTTLVVKGGNPPDRPWKPTTIQISYGQPHYFGLMHEMGHAVQPLLDEYFKSFYRSFHFWYQHAAQRGKEGQLMWYYPKSDNGEYWAEVHDSYYCSAESRADMKARFPYSFQFAQRFLNDPENLSATHESTAAFKVENEPEGDEDKDGILNLYDKCASTEAGLVVTKEGESAGCGAGQSYDYILSFKAAEG